MSLHTKRVAVLVVMAVAVVFVAVARPGGFRSQQAATKNAVGTDPGGIKEGALTAASGHQLAIVSGGCFWGVENRFRHVSGVVATAVGYTGGHTENPTYEQVCTHATGHVESVLVEFDPAKVSYGKLLDLFFGGIDPTTPDQQGPDVGSNYRSAIWTLAETQAQEAHAAIARAQKHHVNKIVTAVAPAKEFYLAEDYHQQYDEKNGTDSCPSGL